MTENSERYWEARWRDEAKLTAEAADFLDGMAAILQERWRVSRLDRDEKYATDCRKMAEKLRNG